MFQNVYICVCTSLTGHRIAPATKETERQKGHSITGIKSQPGQHSETLSQKQPKQSSRQI